MWSAVSILVHGSPKSLSVHLQAQEFLLLRWKPVSNPSRAQFLLTRRTYFTKCDGLLPKSTFWNLSSLPLIRLLETALQQQLLQLGKKSINIQKYSKDWLQHHLVGNRIKISNSSRLLHHKCSFTVVIRFCEQIRKSSVTSTSFHLNWKWKKHWRTYRFEKR